MRRFESGHGSLRACNNNSTPGTLAASRDGSELFRGLALLAAGRTALGSRPVVERAAVLNLGSLARDW